MATASKTESCTKVGCSVMASHRGLMEKILDGLKENKDVEIHDLTISIDSLFSELMREGDDAAARGIRCITSDPVTIVALSEECEEHQLLMHLLSLVVCASWMDIKRQHLIILLEPGVCSQNDINGLESNSPKNVHFFRETGDAIHEAKRIIRLGQEKSC